MSSTDARSRTVARRRGRPVGSDSVETRHRILRAARQVINERGFPAATFQAIAEAPPKKRRREPSRFDWINRIGAERMMEDF